MEQTLRPIHDLAQITPQVQDKMRGFHADVLDQVETAVRGAPLVVVGMAQNPHVKNVRKVLTDAGLEYRYLEFGSYFSQWKERLAIKMWSGWPTFPQVFVQGKLIGGEDLTKAAIADGTLKKMLQG